MISKPEILVEFPQPGPCRITVHPQEPLGIHSEPVDCRKLTTGVPQTVFVYSDSGTLSAEALQQATFAGGCPTTYTSSALIVLNNDSFEVTVYEDSIRFAGNSGSIVDQAGNMAPANARKAVILPGRTTAVECVPFPNPAKIDREIDFRIRQVYAGVVGNATHGMVIGVHSEVPLRGISVGGNDAARTAEPRYTTRPRIS